MCWYTTQQWLQQWWSTQQRQRTSDESFQALLGLLALINAVWTSLTVPSKPLFNTDFKVVKSESQRRFWKQHKTKLRDEATDCKSLSCVLSIVNGLSITTCWDDISIGQIERKKMRDIHIEIIIITTYRKNNWKGDTKIKPIYLYLYLFHHN